MSVVEIERPLPAADRALRGLRLLPAPRSEPPYDDERPGGRPLPLRPASLRPAPPLRLVPPLDDDPVRPSSADLPPAKPFAHALVQRLLEVLAGLRPVSQLQRDTSFELFEELERVVCGRPRTAGPRPSTRDVRSVHVHAREDGVAQVCATVRRGRRVTALALRLEGVSGAWRCTALAGV